jgi:hypothetical protein
MPPRNPPAKRRKLSDSDAAPSAGAGAQPSHIHARFSGATFFTCTPFAALSQVVPFLAQGARVLGGFYLGVVPVLNLHLQRLPCSAACSLFPIAPIQQCRPF